MTLGNKLSRLRKENNYTQEQLAEILGVSRQSISKWESDISYPETDKLIHLSNLFGCSLDYLLKENDESNDYYFNRNVINGNNFFRNIVNKSDSFGNDVVRCSGSRLLCVRNIFGWSNKCGNYCFRWCVSR